MNLRTFLSAVASILVLAGCSSTPGKVDNGPIQAKTFSFVQPPPAPYPGYVDQRAAGHALIQSAIEKNLSGRGLSKLPPGQGDVTVAYLVVIGDNSSTAMVDTYFGQGRDTSEIHTKAQAAYDSAQTSNYFQAGTLLIDVIDAKSNALLKRGYATRPSLRQVPENDRGGVVQGAVDEILRDLKLQ
jgi:hypothetical protein